ncbi:MAG TPA: PhzF family phenazine biosynthesis protein [Acidimicrobiia bacterium]|nr:PhzF family phenazine biosynthesis protein [Acidimicrobiia bacterium]
MVDRRFRLVDVFGSRPLAGNPLAVVVDTDGLTSDDMLEITRWLGFSETTFLGPPQSRDADYSVRIFTLAGELLFAGHPTLGSCHVWQTLADESRDEIVQECGAGLVRLRREEDRYAFAAPPLIRSGPVDEDLLVNLASVLAIDPEDIVDSRWIDNGPGWLGLMLGDAGKVLSLRPQFSRRGNYDQLDIGVVGFHPKGSGTIYEVRAFFSDQHGDMVEDPVTGSLNASVAQWMLETGRVSGPYVASQGTAIGRSGLIYVTPDDGEVWIGGRVFDVVSGLLADLDQT